MKSLGRIWALASNTYREALRNRAFIGLLLLALAFLLFSWVLSELALRDEAVRVVVDFGVFAIGLFSVVIAIVMGVILVHKEVEKKTIFTIIPKPVPRWEIIIGKYLGMLVILVCEIVFMAAVWFFVLWARDAPPTMETVKAIVLIVFETSMIAAVALMFSAFSTPILSGIFSLGFFVVGRVAYLVDQMLESRKGIFAHGEPLRPLGEAFDAIWPDLSVYNVSSELLLGTEITPWYLGATFGYTLAYTVFFVAMAVVLFQRRDFI